MERTSELRFEITIQMMGRDRYRVAATALPYGEPLIVSTLRSRASVLSEVDSALGRVMDWLEPSQPMYRLLCRGFDYPEHLSIRCRACDRTTSMDGDFSISGPWHSRQCGQRREILDAMSTARPQTAPGRGGAVGPCGPDLPADVASGGDLVLEGLSRNATTGEETP